MQKRKLNQVAIAALVGGSKSPTPRCHEGGHAKPRIIMELYYLECRAQGSGLRPREDHGQAAATSGIPDCAARFIARLAGGRGIGAKVRG